MKSHEFFYLASTNYNSRTTIISTDKKVFDIVISRFQEHKCTVDYSSDIDRQNTRAFIRINNESERNAICDWIIKYLCHTGWEPFSEDIAMGGHLTQISFRKEVLIKK
jgi:hypothetical protein